MPLSVGSLSPGAGPCIWSVELHDIYMEPLLKPVRASLDGIPSFTQISCPTQHHLQTCWKCAQSQLHVTDADMSGIGPSI